MENISKNAEANTVSAIHQLDPTKYVRITEKPGAKLKVLFVGNSITRHMPLPSIGWEGDWGMAASCEEKDYVHQTVRLLEEKLGEPVNFCVAQLAEWERRYREGAAPLEEFYIPARDFAADIVIIRIGENINRDADHEVPCEPFYEEMVKFFVTDPDAQVIVTDNFWNIPQLNVQFEAAAKKNGWTFVKIGDLEQDERTMAKGLFWHEGVAAHPSDYGMLKIAERLAGAVNKIVK